MLNKMSQGLVFVLFALLLSACGESQQDQSHVDHLSRAKVYQEQGQYKAAVIEYKNAVKKSKGDVSAFLSYATMLNRLGQHEAALNLLEQVTEGKNEAYYLELVKAFQGLKKFNSAKKVITENLNVDSLPVRLAKAENALGSGELDQAISLFDKLASDAYLKNEGLLGKATVLARMGQMNEAMVLLEQVDQSSSAAVKGNILKAGIQISLQQLEPAEATLSDILAGMRNTDIIEPEKVVVLERLSYVLTRQGRSNEAYIYTKILSEAFPGSNEVRNQFQAAVEKMDAGEMDAAKEMLEAILKDYPNYKKASQMLGIIAYIQGDMQTASKYLSDSVDPEVANEMTRHIYAATNLKLNDPKRVLEILEPGIEKTTIPATLALYGLAAISDRQFEKGEKALLKALDMDNKNVRVRLALANLYRNQPSPDLSKERTQIEQAYQTAPTDKQVITDMLAFLIRNEGVDSARSFIDKALKTNPNDYATNLIAGSFVAGQQQFKRALGHFETAIKTEPKGDELLNAVFAKGRAQLALKEATAAEQTFAELILLAPENQMGYKGILSVYMLKNDVKAGERKLESYAQESNQLAPYAVLIEAAVSRQDLTQAKAYFDKAGKLDVDERELARLGQGIRYVEAVMAMQANDFPEARALVAELLAEEPENLRLLSFLVDVEMKAGQLNEAAKIIAQIENINPDHPVVPLFKGDLAIMNKDMASAKFHLTDAWKKTPSDIVAEKLFKVLGALAEKENQLKHLENWLEVLPGSAAATLYQAINLQQNKQATKAMAAYEKVLEVAPDNVMALNNLGWIYFEKNDPRSLTLLKKAVELAPENAAVLDSYGWVLAKNGKKAEGLPYLEKAHKLAPDEAEIKSHLDEVRAMK
jgi:tetratricopeptide (TPR) repeat protein